MISKKRFWVQNKKAIVDGEKILINNVEFLEVKGSGANAVVFEAIEYPLKRKVAVKFWFIKKEDKRDKLKQSLGEASKVAQLISHPNIVKVHRWDIYMDKLPYVIMECIDGKTLREYLVSQKPDIFYRFENIWLPVEDAIKFAHNKGVYHGDLHDKNILIENNRIVIIDFGTSYFQRDKNNSIKREKQKLLDLVNILFPEVVFFGLKNRRNIGDLRPEQILFACDSLVRIHLSTHRSLQDLGEMDSESKDYKRRQVSAEISNLVSYCPLFDLKDIIDWLFPLFEKKYVKDFLDNLYAYLKAFINRKNTIYIVPDQRESIESKIDKIQPIFEKAKEYFYKCNS